jgi:hypothetical protein
MSQYLNRVGFGWDKKIKGSLDWNLKTSVALATKTFVDGDVTTGTDAINITAHGFAADTVVSLTSTGTLPAGLALATAYYVQVVDADNFDLSLTAGGSSVDITAAAGTGTHSVIQTVYRIAETDLFGTSASGNALIPEALNSGALKVFANSAAAHDALTTAATGQYIQVSAVLSNSTSGEDFGDTTITQRNTSLSSGGINPSAACVIMLPPWKIRKVAFTVNVTSTLADALDGESLYIGFVPCG